MLTGDGLRAETLPARYDGSMITYDLADAEPAAWPDSLKPFSCIYVARHGSRYMTGEKKFRHLLKALRSAEASGNLTDKGQKMLAMADSVITLSHDKWGELSPVGIREQQVLGRQMLRDFPALAGDSAAGVVTVSSFVPRAMMTMYEFNHALMLGNDNLEVRTTSGRENSDLLFFFATDSLYADYRDNGVWKDVTSKFEKRIDDMPARNFFKSTAAFDKSELTAFTLETYSLLQSRCAMGLSAPDDYFMTADQYRQCWELTNLTHYLRNTVNLLDGDIVTNAVRPLAEAIIRDADQAASDNESKTIFKGYFGHAETLLPLLSALRVPGCYYGGDDYDSLQDHWQLQQITPLGANLAIFLLSSPSGTVYASLRLNGHTVQLREGRSDPNFIPWAQLRAQWLSNLYER